MDEFKELLRQAVERGELPDQAYENVRDMLAEQGDAERKRRKEIGANPKPDSETE